MLHARMDDREMARLEARVGAGEIAGEGFRFIEESPLIGQLRAMHLVTLEPAALSFPQPLLDPPALPMQGVYLSGDFDAVGETLTNGLLDGVLTQADAEATTLNGQPFATLLNALNIPPDFDTNNDGAPDAWRFTAEFTATSVKIED
ncbi:hypothetical protein KKF91_09200 [Myxococcota bacterium]|nr:hypothetical protein [Myxococcota bacterium]MBU1430718.1 hypothetical protein [Myxococcota bacterium]